VEILADINAVKMLIYAVEINAVILVLENVFLIHTIWRKVAVLKKKYVKVITVERNLVVNSHSFVVMGNVWDIQKNVVQVQ